MKLCGICRSDTAMLYNDRAVLENHHVSAAYRLLQDDHEMNILSNLSKDDWRWEETVFLFGFFQATAYQQRLKSLSGTSVRLHTFSNLGLSILPKDIWTADWKGQGLCHRPIMRWSALLPAALIYDNEPLSCTAMLWTKYLH